MLADHEAKPNPHPQYVRKVGDQSTGAQLGVTPPQHDDTKKFPTTDWVNRVGVNFPSSGGVDIGTHATLALSDIGRWIDIKANTALLTVPKASTARIGAAFEIQCSANTASLVATDDDLFVFPGGSSSVYPVLFGESFTVVRNGPKEWRIVSMGAMPAGQVSYFAGTTAPPGWLKLNGVTLSRAAYPALWTYALTGGSSSPIRLAKRLQRAILGRRRRLDFRIPDARGVFLRASTKGAASTPAAWPERSKTTRTVRISSAERPRPRSSMIDPGHGHPANDHGHIHTGWTDLQGEHSHGARR